MRPPRRLLALACLFTLTAAPARATTIVLDGLRDPGYVLLTTDPVGDIPVALVNSLTEWTDLTALYAYTTTTDLYIYAALPAYGHDRSSGQFGLAIDLTGDVPNSGGVSDPWGNPITYAFTSTNHVSGAVPLATTHTLLPDVVIRGNIPSSASAGVDVNDGWTELRTWNGSAWLGATVNWGGLTYYGDLLGDHIAYASGYGVEMAIPLADLAVPVSGTLHLHFYTTQKGYFSGAYDALPSGLQTAHALSPTVQHNLTTLFFPADPGPVPDPPNVAFAAAAMNVDEGEVAVALTVNASGSVTQPVTVTASALAGTASALDFVPLSATLGFSPVLTTIPFTVTLLPDDDVESDETILLSLAQPLNAVLGTPAAAVLTILDDDSPATMLLRVLLPLLLR